MGPTTGENHDLYRRLGGDLSPKTLYLGTRALNGGLMLIMHTADVIFIHLEVVAEEDRGLLDVLVAEQTL